MAAHGTEREMERRQTYIASEVMAINVRLTDMEEVLRRTKARLDKIDADYAAQHTYVPREHEV